MKVKVLKVFSDGKRLYYENEILDITHERVDYFNSSSHGLLVEVIDEKEKSSVRQQDGGPLEYLQKYPATEEYLSSLTKKKLVEIADERGISLDIKMTKAEMIKELM